ncbi:MAG: putative metalloprotease CJM1_0395 family protein [Pseudomonadota bacterium]
MEALGALALRAARPLSSGVAPATRQGSAAQANGETAGRLSSASPFIRSPNESPFALSPAEREVVAELRARDREVRAHEQAHKNVAGRYAGAISYEYRRGPDNVRYAVGGSVPIDVSPVAGDPEATIDKMEVVKAAALAPAEPSAQDRAVAQVAQATILQAEAELRVTARDDAAAARAETRAEDEALADAAGEERARSEENSAAENRIAEFSARFLNGGRDISDGREVGPYASLQAFEAERSAFGFARLI